MAATTNEARLAGFPVVAEQTETSETLRYFHNSLLSELPGITFALLTLAYIVISLGTL